MHYFQNLKGIPYLPSFDAGVLTPFELHLFFLLLVWILLFTVKHRAPTNHVPVWFGALVFFVWVVLSVVRGLSSGGEFLPALWETRALIYLGIFYFLVPQMVHTKAQLQTLVWICIIVVSFKAIQGFVRFAELGFGFMGYDTLASTEDCVLMVPVFLLLIGLRLFEGSEKQRRAQLWLLLPLMLGFFVGNRRSIYVSLVASIVALIVLVPRKQRRIVLTFFLVAVVLFGLYLPIFWNSYSRFGVPAQQVKAIIFKDPTMISSRNYSSTIYRDREKYNLSCTIRESPVVGLGFGKKYSTPINLYLKFGLSDYIAHDSILWLFMRTGAIGFFLAFFFFNAYLFYSAFTFSKLHDPYMKALCAVCVVAIINEIVVCNVEMEFTVYRDMIYLGFLMGLVPALKAIDSKLLAPSPAEEHPTRKISGLF